MVAVFFLLICLIWGSTWVGIKVGLDGVPPFLSAGLRFLLSSAVAGLVLAWRRKPITLTRDGASVRLSSTLPALGVPLVAKIINDAVQSTGASAINDGIFDGTLTVLAKGTQDWAAAARPEDFRGAKRIADDPLMQRRLAEATWLLEASMTRMRADAQELQEMAEARVAPSMQQRSHLRWNLNRGCELVGSAVVDLFRAASGRTIFLDHPLQHRFQDVQGALGHAYLAVGRALGGNLLGTSQPEFSL